MVKLNKSLMFTFIGSLLKNNRELIKNNCTIYIYLCFFFNIVPYLRCRMKGIKGLQAAYGPFGKYHWFIEKNSDDIFVLLFY